MQRAHDECPKVIEILGVCEVHVAGHSNLRSFRPRIGREEK